MRREMEDIVESEFGMSGCWCISEMTSWMSGW